MEFRDVGKVKSKAETVEDSMKFIKVQLPSRGVEYGGKILDLSGWVQARPMLVRELKYAAQITPDSYQEMLSLILRATIQLPDDFDPIDLTLGDRQYLFLWLRYQIVTDYNLDITCPSCGKENKGVVYDLKKVPVVSLNEEYELPMKILLPKQKTEVVLRLMTARDEVEVREFVGKHPECDVWISTYAQTASFGAKQSLQQKYKYFESMDPSDFGVIRQFYVWAFHGPDFTECPFTCKFCEKEAKIQLPFRPEFFVPSLPFERDLRDAVHSLFVSRRGARELSGAGELRGRGVSVPSEEDNRASGEGSTIRK